MKRILLALILFTSISSAGYAQSFEDGTNLISIGFGIPPAQRITNDFNKNYKNYIDYRLNNYGTVLLKYEHGLLEYFGMGLNIEYSGAAVSYKYDDTNLLRYERKIKSNAFNFYARFNGHYPLGDKLDIYGGLGLGYAYTINKYTDTNPNSAVNIQQTEKILDFDYQGTLGLRFMIKDNIGIFGEAGWATTTGQIGISFKF